MSEITDTIRLAVAREELDEVRVALAQHKRTADTLTFIMSCLLEMKTIAGMPAEIAVPAEVANAERAAQAWSIARQPDGAWLITAEDSPV